MININTGRWESVRLLFDKRIMGVNLKSNYGWQLTLFGAEEARPLQQIRSSRTASKGRRVEPRRT